MDYFIRWAFANSLGKYKTHNFIRRNFLCLSKTEEIFCQIMLNCFPFSAFYLFHPEVKLSRRTAITTDDTTNITDNLCSVLYWERERCWNRTGYNGKVSVRSQFHYCTWATRINEQMASGACVGGINSRTFQLSISHRRRRRRCIPQLQVRVEYGVLHNPSRGMKGHWVLVFLTPHMSFVITNTAWLRRGVVIRRFMPVSNNKRFLE